LSTGGSALDGAKVQKKKKKFELHIPVAKWNNIMKFGINTFFKFIFYSCASYVVLVLIDFNVYYLLLTAHSA
jgi:hypothetical protein